MYLLYSSHKFPAQNINFRKTSCGIEIVKYASQDDIIR